MLFQLAADLLQFFLASPPRPPPKKKTILPSIGKRLQLQNTGMLLQLKTLLSYYHSVKLLEFCNKTQIAGLLAKTKKENNKKIKFHKQEEVANPSRLRKKNKQKTSIFSLR